MKVGSAGFHHPAVHAARLLQQKKHRQERRCFLVEGPALVEAALRSGIAVNQVFYGDDGAIAGIRALLERTAAELTHVDARTLASLSATRTPQAMVAVAPFFDRPLDQLPAASAGERSFILVLHEVSDPGNAGTLVRSAEAFGARAVCFGPQAVEPYNDKVVRAAMGSLFRLPLFVYQDWADFKTAAATSDLQLVGGDARAPDVRTVTLPSRMALLVGQERRGLRDIPAGDLHASVGLPQVGKAESLNAAVAGSLLLYETARSLGILGAARENN